MAPRESGHATGAIEISAPLFGVVTGLWLFAIASLTFVSIDPSIAGPKHWHIDGPAHVAVFTALTLVPGLFARSTRLLVTAMLVITGLAAGLEVAQATRLEFDLERGDVLANFLGLVTGMLVAVVVRRQIRGRRPGGNA